MGASPASGPWENYQAESGPWNNYAQPKSTDQATPTRPKPDSGFLHAVGEDASAMLPHSMADVGKGALNTIVPGSMSALSLINSYRQGDQQRKDAGHGLGYRALAPLAASATGVNLPAMEKSAEQGDTAGVLGHTALPTALAASPVIHEFAPVAGRATARAAAPVLDLAGNAVGHPMLTAGNLLKQGAGMARRLGETEPEYTPVQGTKVPRLDFRSQKFTNAEAAKAAREATPDIVAPPPIRFPKGSQAPARIAPPPVKFQEAQPPSPVRRVPPPPVKFPEGPVSVEGNRIVQPGQIGESRILKPGENFDAVRPKGGAPWTWSNERIKEMAEAGDQSAIQVAHGRGIRLSNNPTSQQLRNAPLPRGGKE